MWHYGILDEGKLYVTMTVTQRWPRTTMTVNKELLLKFLSVKADMALCSNPSADSRRVLASRRALAAYLISHFEEFLREERA